MNGHEEGSDSERIEMEETTPLQDAGDTREEGLNEEDQHQDEGLTNDNTAASEQDEALKACMTFALLNDKTQFVGQFIEKKFILTYGFLEKLYSRVKKDTLLYKLLLELLKERLGTSWEPDPSDPLKEISLFEVSGVLKKFMGEEKPFYLRVLGLKDFIYDFKALKALKRAKELLKGECSYRNQRCESPWTDLFIWAVLQNHSDMAVFLWEKSEEPVLNALGASQILKVWSTFAYQKENKLSMEKLSQKFEDRAHGILDSCYQSNESHSFELLHRKSPVWDTTCFHMGIAADSHSFLKNYGLKATLSRAWWGDMEKDQSVWKILLTLFCPLLICTNLIYLREPDGLQQLADKYSGKPKPSFLISRWRQFGSAPISSFVGNAVMYFPFLFLFAYVLLVDFKPPPPSGPSIWEYMLYLWVFTFLCQEINEALFMHNMTFSRRMKLYMEDVSNKYDCTAIILFFIGLICRMFEWSYEFGRCVLCIDYMVFTVRLIHIFAVSKQMGPKLIIALIAGNMMGDVFSFVLVLAVWIVAYGVATQGLLYPYDSKLDRIFRRVFYRPYLHTFGELNLEEIDGGLDWDMAHNCTSNVTEIEGGAEPCRNEYWLSNCLVIILLVVFLLVTVVLLLNLLIAMLSKTFEDVLKESDIYWNVHQYNLIIEYQSNPRLAPPFIIVNHLHLFFSFFFSFLKKTFHREPPSTTARHRTDASTDHYFDELCKAGHGTEEQKELMVLYRAGQLKDWETKQKQKFLADQWDTEGSSDSERIKQISDKVDNMWKQQTVDNVLIQQTGDSVSRMLDQQTVDTVDRETIDQKIQQMTDRMERMEEQQQNQLRTLETKMEKCISDALGQILDRLSKPPST